MHERSLTREARRRSRMAACAAKAQHRERLATAKAERHNVDSAVAAALEGSADVFLGTRAEAEQVVARLRVLLEPGGPANVPPLFHGPESHRGTGTAPDAGHFNAEGYHRGKFVDVHIYFGGK